MFKLIIIEDEHVAAERLCLLVKEYDPSIEVVAVLSGVEETLTYLQTKPAPDLLLMDIHLSDGNSFEILQKLHYNKPVIFTTAYNEFALEAFKSFSIDYILKPVRLQDLATAFNKYKSMAGTFLPAGGFSQVPDFQQQAYKKRFLAKIGQRLFFVAVEKVSFFQADNKIVHLTDREGHKYLVDTTMERLAGQLEPALFFRVNRTYIIHINAIRQVKPYVNNRLLIVAEGIAPDDEIIVSRERVSEFRDWANG